MEKIHILQNPEDARSFLRAPGPRFILLTRRRVNESEKFRPST